MALYITQKGHSVRVTGVDSELLLASDHAIQIAQNKWTLAASFTLLFRTSVALWSQDFILLH